MCLKLRTKGILLIKPNYKYSHLLNLNIEAIRERKKNKIDKLLAGQILK